MISRGDEFACESGGFDGDVQGPGHEAAHVEEAQAAFVLLVGVVGFGGDAGVLTLAGQGECPGGFVQDRGAWPARSPTPASWSMAWFRSRLNPFLRNGFRC
nr:hypothetical protein [Nocardia pseudovaccinii]